MIATSQSGWDFRWFIPLFIAGWLAISYFLSLIGGWHTLARKHRGITKIAGAPFYFSSMVLGSGFSRVNYNGCIFVCLNGDGFELWSPFPFGFFHPRLFIPWSAVSRCRRERYWFRDCTEILLSEPRTQMRFYGRVGKAIHEFRNRSF